MSAVAFFISAHGLGHAARAAAVMQALHDRRPHLRCEIFSAAPAWFFHESLTGPWRYHALAVDVGLVQVDSLHEDMPATLAALDAFYPLDAGLVQALARQIVALGCELVLCDIAPLGIAVAAAAGLPSVLIENFTWEWIYAGLEEAYPDLRRHRCYLAQLFAAADHRIQAEPVCVAQAGAFTTPPIARRPRQTRTEIRQRLGVAANAPLVLLTMGGAAWEYAFLPRLTTAQPDIQFLIPGSVSQVERRQNLFLLPRQSGWYHPDLIQAVDAVVGKLGYSTVAEAYHSRVPFVFVTRPTFRESAVLQAFVQAHLPSLALTAPAFAGGEWLAALPPLLAPPQPTTASAAAAAPAAAAAAHLLSLLWANDRQWM